MNALEHFRIEKDEFFRNDPRSPLTADQAARFKGLAYFPENPALVLQLSVEKALSSQDVMLQTSTGDARVYERFGRIRFEVEGEPAELTLFSDGGDLFLPFVDALAGSETYPAGRYLEPLQLPNGQVLVDFNYAYNPYCAYNERWSCPLPPAENRLKVAIRAGEKLFTDHHETN